MPSQARPLRPSTPRRAVIARIAAGDKEDIDRPLRRREPRLRRVRGGRCLRPSETGNLRLGDLVEEHADELSKLDTLDNGMPLGISGFAYCLEMFRYMAGWTTKLEGNTIPLVPYTPGPSTQLTRCASRSRGQ